MKKLFALTSIFLSLLFCGFAFGAGNVVIEDQTLTTDQLTGPGMIMNDVTLHAGEIIIWDQGTSTNPDGPGTCSAPEQPTTTVLLLHFDYGELEESGSTNFVDCSGSTDSPHSIFAGPPPGVQGDIHMNSGAKKFGRSGARLDGTGDYLVWECVDGDDLDPRKMEFTVELFIKTTQNVGFSVIFATQEAAPDFWFGMNDGKAAVYNSVHGMNTSTGADIANGQWNHILWSRDSTNTMRIFVNGSVDHTVNNWTDDIYDGDSNRTVGWDGANPAFNGDMDELRFQIGDGVGVSQAFNPPEEPY